MRGLQIYFCPDCGHYGFFQLEKRAVCPKCHTAMHLLLMDYVDFMDLDCTKRDELITNEMLRLAQPYVKRLVEPYKNNNNREKIGALIKRISELEKENQKLSETVEWMHDTIWQMLRESKGLSAAETNADDEAAASVSFPSEEQNAATK